MSVPALKQTTVLSDMALSQMDIYIMGYGDWNKDLNAATDGEATPLPGLQWVGEGTKWRRLGKSKDGTTYKFEIAESLTDLMSAEGGGTPEWRIVSGIAATLNDLELIEIDDTVRKTLSNSTDDTTGNVVNKIGAIAKEFSIRISPKDSNDPLDDLIIPRVSIQVTEGKDNTVASPYSMKCNISAMWTNKILTDDNEETLVVFKMHEAA